MIPTGPCPASIMIVGEAPGEWEERRGTPFCGPSGQELDKMLHEAGILRSECFCTNVCAVRPLNNDIENFFIRRARSPGPDWHPVKGGFAKAPVIDGLKRLEVEVSRCRPKVIIAVGNLALWALTGQWGISSWRGSLMKCSFDPSVAVIPTIHPAAVLRQWSDRRYVVLDLKRAARQAGPNPVTAPHYNFLVRPQFPQAVSCLTQLIKKLGQGPLPLAGDIETRAGQIACIGFAWSKTDAVCIPLMCVERREGYWSEAEERYIIQLLQTILTHPNARIFGQNWIYDSQYLIRYLKVRPQLALDTMLAHHVCFPGTEKGLDVLSSLYCEYHLYWKDDGKTWDKNTGEDQLWSYNCMDCVRTFEIAQVLIQVVESLGLADQCVFQHKMWWRALDTMVRGVRIDQGAKASLSKSLAAEAIIRDRWITEVLGHPLNIRSPKQMKELFYNDLHLPVQTKRGTGKPTLDDEALLKLTQKEPIVLPLVRKIRELRSIGVFRSTFVESRLDADQRMRCSYNVAGTETFRFSSSENAFGSGGNLQNIPKGGSIDPDGGADDLELPNVRAIYIPDEGYEIADMDLSSADLRIVVWEADEREMKDMLAAGLDPYTEIAKEFYKDPSISKKDPRRQKFKSFAHGTNYLGTPRGLATRLGLSVAEAERTQAWYFRRFPRIKANQDRLKAKLLESHFVQNAFGYRRYFFDRIDGTVFNQAAAWIPQSTVGLLINTIWDRILDAEPQVQVLLQVHDSLVLQYPLAQAEYFRARLQEISRIVIPYADPLIIPTGFKYSSKSWGDCE